MSLVLIFFINYSVPRVAGDVPGVFLIFFLIMCFVVVILFFWF
jgi:hypothetical protein